MNNKPTISCSYLEVLLNCSQSLRLKTYRDKQSYDASAGSRQHKIAELMLIDDINTYPSDTEENTALYVSVCKDIMSKRDSVLCFIEKDLEYEYDNFILKGKPDAVFVTDKRDAKGCPFGVLTIVDLKNGYGQVDPMNYQMIGYGLLMVIQLKNAFAFRYSPIRIIEFVVIQENQIKQSPAIFQ